MHRFFISPENISESKVIFPNDISRQLYKVFRSKKGDYCLVFDGTGTEYLVNFNQVSSSEAFGDILEIINVSREPAVKLFLYQALIKSDRFEYAIQKSVELGVHEIIPVLSERTEYAIPSDSRFKRWENIIREAAEQSKRTILPALRSPITLNEALQQSPKRSIIPWEMENSKGIKEVLHNIKEDINENTFDMGIFIGPVGGFSQKEIEFAIYNKITPVSLGPRIFRAETAGIIAATAILYEFGDLAG